MGRCIITENSWLTSPLPSKRLNDREVRVGWYDRKEPGFGIREPRFNSQPNHWGCTGPKLWFRHYTMMTPNTSGHFRHILAAWAIWAPEAPHILAALCHRWVIQENTWLLLCLCLRMRKLVNISEHPKRATTCLIRSQLFSKLPRTASVRQGNVVRQTDMFSLQMLSSFTKPPGQHRNLCYPSFRYFFTEVKFTIGVVFDTV